LRLLENRETNTVRGVEKFKVVEQQERIMAVPKKKSSKSRRNMRRFAAGNKLEVTTLKTCPSCSEPTRPHRVCGCGFYAGKSVIPAKTARANA
jgi:large subunit ribosomal protein L32